MRKRFFYIITVILSAFYFSCKEKEVEFSKNDCRRLPAFISSMGFNPSRSYLTTSEEKIMGMVLIESEKPGNPAARTIKSFQHPSWKMGGWLAPILIDENGNVFTAPAPFISILNNPVTNNNTVYRVDNSNGEMKEFLRLPFADSVNTDNPFGIIGMAYLCEKSILYVSTLAGSRRYEEKGHIYAINTQTGKVIDEIKNTDALGIGISYITGKRELFFGKGRSPEVMSVVLNSEGKFSGTPKPAFSLAGLGPEGDDRARKIRPDQYGNLMVHGMEFNYNLIPQREKQETVYQFAYFAEDGKWVNSR